MNADPALLDRVRRQLVTEVPALIEADLRDRALLFDAAALAATTRGISEEVSGAGPLQALLDQPGVTDVLVNGPNDVWVEQRGTLRRTPTRFSDEGAVRRLAVRMAVAAGQRLDDASPWVDAALADGTRLHAVIPPLVPATTISLRVLRRLAQLNIDAPAEVVEVLRTAVATGLGTLIVGPTGAGKTTLLASLLAGVPADQRIVVVEDTAELAINHPHVVGLVTRASNVEGVGGVDLSVLIRQALRMRPDRLVVGEFRGAETGLLLGALTSGHRGAATMHAWQISAVPARLHALGALSGLSQGTVASMVPVAFEVVVVVGRGPEGRWVAELGTLSSTDERLSAEVVWSRRDGFTSGWELLQNRLRL